MSAGAPAPAQFVWRPPARTCRGYFVCGSVILCVVSLCRFVYGACPGSAVRVGPRPLSRGGRVGAHGTWGKVGVGTGVRGRGSLVSDPPRMHELLGTVYF